MDFKSEWARICRICLKDANTTELFSIFHKNNENELNYSEKIMQCTNIEVKKNQNLPEQICSSCILDLEASYRFKMNCESSDAILQTYVHPPTANSSASNCTEASEEESDNDNDHFADNDDMYNYKSNLYEENTNNATMLSNDYIKKEDEEIDYDEVKKTLSNEVGEISSKTKKDGTKETIVRLKRSISNDKQPKIHICEICANTYKYRHALEVHMRRHRGDKPYQCEHCERRFVIRFELKRHMRTHTGHKPYGCRYCERKFSDFGSRIKHERSHTGERPYVCQTCGKTFAYSHVLSGHMLTHTGEKRHVCTQCGKRFTKSHHLKSHLNTHLKALNKSGQAQMAAQNQHVNLNNLNMSEPDTMHAMKNEQDHDLMNVVQLGFQVINSDKY